MICCIFFYIGKIVIEANESISKKSGCLEFQVVLDFLVIKDGDDHVIQ